MSNWAGNVEPPNSIIPAAQTSSPVLDFDHDQILVQRKGSIASLILNLQRAQNNPSVQRLIVVASTADIDRIQQEISDLPESFRRAVGFIEVVEIIRSAKLIEELSGIIDKLQLVRSEFGT